MQFGFELKETLRQQAGSYNTAPPVGASLLAIACIIAAFQSSGRKHKNGSRTTQRHLQ
jgi:hypothetical protein